MTKHTELFVPSQKLARLPELSSPAELFRNPVDERDKPDPWVVYLSNIQTFLCATTQGLDPETGTFMHLPVSASPDGVNWGAQHDLVPELAWWNNEVGNIWAPHFVQREDGTWIGYISSGINPKEGTGHVLATIQGKSLFEPFTIASEPLVGGKEPGFKDIDPMVFSDPETGDKLLIWGSGGHPLRIRPLAKDLTSFEPGSSEREVFFPQTGLEIIEAPWLYYNRHAKPESRYTLTFSAGDCCGDADRYKVYLATARHAQGPFTLRGVFLKDGPTIKNPGHHSFIVTPDGQHFQDGEGKEWMAYHGVKAEYFTDGKRQGAQLTRSLSLDPVQFDEEGMPFIENQEPSSQPQRPIVR